MTLEIHPVLPLTAGIPLALVFRGTARRTISLLAPAVALALLIALPEDARIAAPFLGHDWILLRVDAMSQVFAFAFALFAFIAGLYGWHDANATARAAGLGLGAAGVGVALAGDWATLFFFWEWLSVCSLILVWSAATPASTRAGLRYIYLHLAGGACFMAGITLLWVDGRSLEVGPLALDGAASWLILAAFAANAAIPPLHAWLPDAYPAATSVGMVYLSAFTTKAAVYALARAFPGEEILEAAGVGMALYGVVFAVLENDIRRLLGYHIISQVGYMVCGIGLGTALALNGTVAHAFSHIFYKGLLLMAAGSVLHATGRSKLTELGGLGRSLPAVLALYAIGAFSISGVPLFNGFVSKAVIVSAAELSGRWLAELLLVVASMGTFLHTGLKLPYFTFFERSRGAPVAPVPKTMIAAMALAAAICVVTGVHPELLYRALPAPMEYHPYSLSHTLGALQLLVGTALGFWILRRRLGGEPTVTRDVDGLYRVALPAASAILPRAAARAGDRVIAAAQRLAVGVARLEPYRQTLGLRSTFAGQTAIILAAFVALLLVIVL